MNNKTSSDQVSKDLAAIPTAQGGLSRLVITRLTSAGVPQLGLAVVVRAQPR